jgi:hypothetical protein
MIHRKLFSNKTQIFTAFLLIILIIIKVFYTESCQFDAMQNEFNEMYHISCNQISHLCMTDNVVMVL